MRQWSATEMPRMRRELTAVLEELSIPGNDFRDFHGHVGTAELFWATKEMTAAAWDASIDLPDWRPLDAAPCPVGLILWARALPPISTEHLRERTPYSDTPISGVLWRIHDDGYLHVRALARNEHFPAHHRPDADAQLLPIAYMSPLAADQPIGLGDTETVGSGLIAMLGATWLMMQNPGVAATRTVNGAGGSGRTWTRQERLVKLVDLRPPAEHATPATDTTGRTYTHRWIVRGHWKQQPHGPGRALRRPTWISSYIAGPSGAPLLEKETVWVWRR